MPLAGDPYFEVLVKNADRVFYFDEGPGSEAKIAAKAIPDSKKPDDSGGVLMVMWPSA